MERPPGVAPHQGAKRYDHPLVGGLHFSHESFHTPGDTEQALCVYNVEPVSETGQVLRVLVAAGQRPRARHPMPRTPTDTTFPSVPPSSGTEARSGCSSISQGKGDAALLKIDRRDDDGVVIPDLYGVQLRRRALRLREET